MGAVSNGARSFGNHIPCATFDADMMAFQFR